MWKLVSTEIKYFQWLYIISIAFVVIVNAGISIEGRWIEAQDDFPGLRIIWLGVGIVVLFFSLLFNKKSGRLRNQVLLPVSLIKLAFVRLVAFILFWLTLITILILFYIINFGGFPTQNWLINLLSVSGLMFLINSIPILNSDFYSTYLRKNEKVMLGILWGFLWLIYIGMNIIFMPYLDYLAPEFFESARERLTSLYFSSGVLISNVLCGFGFFFISLYTFQKRKLYLE